MKWKSKYNQIKGLLEETKMTSVQITLKDFITKLNKSQSPEEVDVLWGSITEIKTEKVKSKHGTSTVYNLRFTIKTFEVARKSLYKQYNYLDKKLIDEYLMEAILKSINKTNIDLSKSENQINAFVYQSIVGFAKNALNQEVELNHNVLRYDDAEQLDKLRFANQDYALNLFDKAQFDNKFERYIDHKGIANILSNQQLEVYEYVQAGLTQVEIAEIMDCSQQNISKLINAANERIKKEQMNFVTFEMLAKDKLDIYKQMQKYLNDLDKIAQFDTYHTFDYFGFTKDFLMNHYSHYQPDNDKAFNLIDLIFDNLKTSDYELFDKFFSGSSINSKDQKRIIRAVIKIFNEQSTKHKDVAENMYSNIVEYYHKDYNEFVSLIS